jgi:hypothetical protein
MSTKKMTNSDRKKRGGIYLAIAAVCIFIVQSFLPQIRLAQKRL